MERYYLPQNGNNIDARLIEKEYTSIDTWREKLQSEIQEKEKHLAYLEERKKTVLLDSEKNAPKYALLCCVVSMVLFILCMQAVVLSILFLGIAVCSLIVMFVKKQKNQEKIKSKQVEIDSVKSEIRKLNEELGTENERRNTLKSTIQTGAEKWLQTDNGRFVTLVEDIANTLQGKIIHLPRGPLDRNVLLRLRMEVGEKALMITNEDTTESILSVDLQGPPYSIVTSLPTAVQRAGFAWAVSLRVVCLVMKNNNWKDSSGTPMSVFIDKWTDNGLCICGYEARNGYYDPPV